MASEAGKGSGRRPAQVSREQVEANWDRIFAKKPVEVVNELSHYGLNPSMITGCPSSRTQMFKSTLEKTHG